MSLKFLEEFRHKHGILATGYANRNIISGTQHFICIYRLGKGCKKLLMKFLSDAFLYLFLSYYLFFILLICSNSTNKPFMISAFKKGCIVSSFSKCFRRFFTIIFTGCAINYLPLIPVKMYAIHCDITAFHKH